MGKEKIYKFYDTDITGSEEYDIVGDEYKKLISVCSKYCSVLSLVITNINSYLLKKIENFEIPKNDNITFQFEHYRSCGFEIKYYRVCDELIYTIISHTNNIFCWINGWGYSNPEDPTFYREDGSVFFTSTIHNGVCEIFVDESKEDISEIISDKRWQETNLTGTVRNH